MNEEVQSWNKQRYRFEVDSSPKAFEYYKKIYSERVKAAYQIDTPVFFRYNAENRKYIDAPEVALLNRLFAISNKADVRRTITIDNRSYAEYDPVERLSGDCFFNFNEKKVGRLKRIRGVDLELLKMCEEMHYSPYNLVLLQTMGGLQKRKSIGVEDYFDRGDSFLYLLKEFYSGNEMILSSSSESNLEALREYLLEFNSIEAYCKEMLQITQPDLINKLCAHGKEKIDSENINRYLEDARLFWDARKQEIDKKGIVL